MRSRVGERTSATRSAFGGVGRSAICVGSPIPALRSEPTSFAAASFAGSEEKPLALVEPLKPELKARPERGPM